MVPLTRHSPFNPDEPPTKNERKRLSRWERFVIWFKWFFNLEF